MEPSRVQKLYDTIFVFSKRFRRRYPDDNFNEAWDAVCGTLADGDIPFSSWGKEVSKGGMSYSLFAEKVMNLPEKVISGYGIEELIEQNHFIIEIFRIPMHMPPTLKNLMRIAYYSGLLSAKLRQRDFPEGLVKRLRDLKALDMINFVNSDTIASLDQKISDEFVTEIQNELKTFYSNYNTNKMGSDESSSSDSD